MWVKLFYAHSKTLTPNLSKLIERFVLTLIGSSRHISGAENREQCLTIAAACGPWKGESEATPTKHENNELMYSIYFASSTSKE